VGAVIFIILASKSNKNNAMPYLNFNSSSPTLKLVITILSVLTIGIIVWFIGFMLSRIFFSLDVPSSNEILYGTGKFTLSQVKYYQLVQAIGFFVIPGFFLHWIFSTPESGYFPIRRKPHYFSILLIAITLILSIPLINYLIKYNQSITFPDFLSNLEGRLKKLELNAELVTTQLLTANNFGAYLINLLIIAIIPAVGEEFLFRGVLQKIFQDITKNKHMAVLLAAILFSAIHGQFFGFIPRFALGVFFGYIMLWSNNIWLPVLAHFINNAIAVTMYFLNSKVNLDFNRLETFFSDGRGIILSVLLCFAGVYFIKSISKNSINA
jgi:uncharacterized protein